MAVPALRTPLLRSAGRVLVAEDPLHPADIIVVTLDSGGGGVLEAADLVHSRIAPRVAVFADPPDVTDREFIRRGVAYEDAAARSIRQLGALGIGDVEQIPKAVAGTEDEGEVLPGWCDERGWRSIVVVSSADHSRRIRRVLRRAMKGHQTNVSVRPTRYSRFEPDQWWRSRAGTRAEMIELEKLLLDLVHHPIS